MPAAFTKTLSITLARVFRRRYPPLELIQPAVQRPDALQDQRAVGRRVPLATLRFCPLIAGKVLPARLIVFANSRHGTSVAGHDNRPPLRVRYAATPPTNLGTADIMRRIGRSAFPLIV